MLTVKRQQGRSWDAALCGFRVEVLVVHSKVRCGQVVIAMVGKILGKDKVDIRIANDGHEGLARATEQGHVAFDLIFMDVQVLQIPHTPRAVHPTPHTFNLHRARPATGRQQRGAPVCGVVPACLFAW